MKWITRHFGVCFWLCWLLLAAAASLEGLLHMPEWVCGVVILLLNGISWPAAVGFFRAANAGYPTLWLVKKAVEAQVVATTLLPFVYFCL